MPRKPVCLERSHLAARLRRLREHSGRTLTEVAANFGWSDAKLRSIENAAIGIRDHDLARLLKLYRVPEPECRQLATLAARARQRARWESTFEQLLSDAYPIFLAFEVEAAAILAFEPHVVPGILQTAEYASAVMRRSVVLEGPDAVSQGVSSRLARQAVLVRDPPPNLSVIIDEAVLRRRVGSDDVMRRQLLRLLETAEQPNVTIQVLPLSVGAHPGVAGSFEILRFGDDTALPVVYCEDLTGGLIRDSPSDVRRYQRAFEVLQRMALAPEATKSTIESFASG
jgi:transcriptional regulator with XRE-family HTH domain